MFTLALLTIDPCAVFYASGTKRWTKMGIYIYKFMYIFTCDRYILVICLRRVDNHTVFWFKRRGRGSTGTSDFRFNVPRL